jgi:hypothetical protein
MKVNKTAILVVGFSILAASYAAAATNASIVVSGTVPDLTSITVSTASDIQNLDLSADISGKSIATVTERSNRRTGYTVTLQSANGGALVGVDPLNADTVPYTLTYGGSPVTFSSGTATVTDASSKTTGTGTSKNLAISVAGATLFPNSDTYSDTLTFTIAAK